LPSSPVIAEIPEDGITDPWITFTDAGIDSDVKFEQPENAFSSIAVSLHSSSKVKDESDPHAQKQRRHRISTDARMQINSKLIQ
jgi:hypothetical protein